MDIRNHSNLTDSLEQYVKGELLEGADAYHCDKCNKKVLIFEIRIISLVKCIIILYRLLLLRDYVLKSYHLF